jgi:D-threonate/D-erythronate kinase
MDWTITSRKRRYISGIKAEAKTRRVKLSLQQIRYGIIADDLTGAADAAAAFARCGLTAAVALESRRIGCLKAQVVALSTHSRHDPPATARRKVRRACAQLTKAGWTVLYKKIDSTVKGNIIAEVEAARDAGGFATALVCPANPRQGRTVRRGVLHVRGDRSVNLRERFRVKGMTESDWVASPISVAKVLRAAQQGSRFIVADGTNERDLACLAGAVFRSKERILLAGSAAMAGELGKLLMERKPARLSPNGKRPRSRGGKMPRRNTIIITGSNNPATQRQLRTLTGETQVTSLALNRFTGRVAAAALASKCNVIINVPTHPQPDPAILAHLKLLAYLFRASLVGSLLIVGGDTTLLICRCLRPTGIAISGEIVPGLAWGKFVGGLAHGLTVCTKPGGFGDDRSLASAVRFLAGAARVSTDATSLSIA